MSSNADLKRIKLSLERERVRLRADALQLEKDRRALQRERADAVLVLRRLTDRYGRPDWPDELPLSLVLDEYLLRPLADRAASIIDPQPAPRPVAPEPLPERREPLALPQRARRAVSHRCLVVPAATRGLRGFRAACICGWTSVIESVEGRALLAGAAHDERYPDDRREARG